ncbi:hypothetical protein [uncultured Flavobacterium sp.]|uniref:hypothetical protein n=1 Tax=uncultured Flavobacterium sp. TaxID=165435 RepID=UPI0030CA41EE
MKIKLQIICVFIFGFTFAQNYKATIENVKQNGYHKIFIAPEVRSASMDNLSYFRIFDSKNNEVSYLVSSDNINTEQAVFKSKQIISKTSRLDSITELVIDNELFNKNNELAFKISNTKHNKKYKISGSYNAKDWYGLISNQVFTNLNHISNNFVIKTVTLPNNDYNFLKIVLNDKESLPINISEVGSLKINRKQLQTCQVTNFQYKITENKKDKKTIITFLADDFQKVDQISFVISNKLFSRNASLLLTKTKTIKRQTQIFQEEVSNFVLNSSTLNSFQLNGFFEKKFTIEIENKDNQPLAFSEIELLQKSLYVIADIKTNEKYQVSIDSSLTKPQYDLGNFINESKIDYPKATISNLTTIETEKENTSKKPFWQSNAFMWICILFGIAIIGYFAKGLLKDMKN